jgi:lipoprotein signal peptidase
MPDRSFRVLLWSLAFIGLAADQATKYGVFAWLRGVESHAWAVFQTEPDSRSFETVPAEGDPFQRMRQRGFFLEVAFEHDEKGDLRPHVNHGALFGLFREQKSSANAGFALISLLAAAGIIVWSLNKTTASDRWLCASLGLILAGTLGNLYDRLMFNGVRDFLHWNYMFDWPVFNVADVCLVCGAGMLLLQAFFAPQQEPDKDKDAGDAAKVLAVAGAGTGVTAGTTVG